jgi:hypothetical protein
MGRANEVPAYGAARASCVAAAAADAADAAGAAGVKAVAAIVGPAGATVAASDRRAAIDTCTAAEPIRRRGRGCAPDP